MEKLAKLPPLPADNIYLELEEELKDFNHKIVVLDDDPTGVQTVNGIFVYTDWTYETILKAFQEPEPMFFIMTNSRSFNSGYTREVHTEIARRLKLAAKKTNKKFVLISRSDSTLRGHYPLETETLRQELSSDDDPTFDGEVLCPFFPEGGRFTLSNIHYIKEGTHLTPAGETEFSKDQTFGYHSSNLTDYVEEKTKGVYKKEDCICISIEDLRSCSLSKIYNQLMQAEGFQKIIVNAADYKDICIFCLAWIKAMRAGKHYISRSAAALPKIIGNIKDIPLLEKMDMILSEQKNGGLVIIGSHVNKTTIQLNHLKESCANLIFLEFHVNAYFTPDGLAFETNTILEKTEAKLLEGKTVVIYTSRDLLIPKGASKEKILATSVAISGALTNIVRSLKVTPRFLIAKGGITSSDVGTKGLSVKKALVIGQVKKGIPVWLTGKESKFPGMPYIIFPGNVGEPDTLCEIVDELM